eukprot:292563-Rhodomonas_salina.2
MHVLWYLLIYAPMHVFWHLLLHAPIHVLRNVRYRDTVRPCYAVSSTGLPCSATHVLRYGYTAGSYARPVRCPVLTVCHYHRSGMLSAGCYAVDTGLPEVLLPCDPPKSNTRDRTFSTICTRNVASGL